MSDNVRLTRRGEAVLGIVAFAAGLGALALFTAVVMVWWMG